MRGWIENISDNWFILAISPARSSEYVAFMPIGLRLTRSGRFKLRELYMGGNPYSDHTGFICIPEYEKLAMAGFSDFIQKQLKWDIFKLREVFDPRFAVFLEKFSSRKFNVKQLDSTVCPFIVLPDSFDQYLNNFIGSNRRKKIRRCLKKIDGNELRVSHVNTDNLE